MMNLTFVLIAACFSIYGCDKQEDYTSIVNLKYNTSVGTVTGIFDYPLYRIDYTSDYKFDEYLQTGIINFDNTFDSDSNDYQCTCFSASGENAKLFGRNYDWPEHASYYLVFTNPESAYSSVSTVDLSFFKYVNNEPPDFPGNLNTVKILPYFPFDGMNEKGLAIGMNAVENAQLPNDPEKVTIGELQLIRLVLDYAASVEEAILLIEQYNIKMEDPPIHYLLADSTGHSVTIEFVDGNMEVIHNSNPWQVTTNFVITGVNITDDAPCWRFNTAYESLSLNTGNISLNEAAHILQSVSVHTTRWSVVYNLSNGQVQIATGCDYDDFYKYYISN